MTEANFLGTNDINSSVLSVVTDKIASGQAFPSLEDVYQRAIGQSDDRAILLAFLAEQRDERAEYNFKLGQVFLSRTRSSAQDLGVEYMDQLLPRLIEEKYGPILVRVSDSAVLTSLQIPVFRAYVKLRRIGRA